MCCYDSYSEQSGGNHHESDSEKTAVRAGLLVFASVLVDETPARLSGVVVLGALTGMMITLADRLSRDAYIEVA